MTDLTIRLDQLDALAGLLPERTPPHMVAEIARWAIDLCASAQPAGVDVLVVERPVPEILRPFVDAALEVGVAMSKALENACRPAPGAEEPVICNERATAPGEWTDEEKQTLERLWSEGAEVPGIAAALPGRTRRGIGEMRRRIGLPARAPRQAPRPALTSGAWTEAEEAVLMRMWAKGASSSEIAAALPGRTAKAVQCRKGRLQARSDITAAKPAADATEAPPTADAAGDAPAPVDAVMTEGAPAPAGASLLKARKSGTGLSEGARLILEAMAALDDSFEPADDKTLVEQRYLGAGFPGIAEALGCDEDTAKARWRAILKCRVQNSGGIITPKGWADLRAAVDLRAAGSEAEA